MLTRTASCSFAIAFAWVAFQSNVMGQGLNVAVSPYTSIEGGVSQLTVTPVGTGPFTYAWRRDGVAVSDGPTPVGSIINGSATQVLTLSNVGFRDRAALYSVRVTYPNGTVVVSSGARVSAMRIRRRGDECFEYVLTNNDYPDPDPSRHYYHAVTIPDEATQQWIVNNMLTGDASVYWFDLSMYRFNNGWYRYERPEEYIPATYFAWAPGQPTPSGTGSYVVMNRAFQNGTGAIGEWSVAGSNSLGNSYLYRRPLVGVMTPVERVGNVYTVTAVPEGGSGQFTYQWYRFDRTPLFDGVQADGSIISGAATSVITLTNPTWGTGFPIHVLATEGSCAYRADVPLSIPTPDGCDSIDLNNDGSYFDPLDIEIMMFALAQCAATGPFCQGGWDPDNWERFCNEIDFNNDGSYCDPLDAEAFLSVYSEGPCVR